jgi:hypothetical protein
MFIIKLEDLKKEKKNKQSKLNDELLSWKKCVIYSKEWNAYWGRNYCGYYSAKQVQNIGVFNVKDVLAQTFPCGKEKGIEFHKIPEEIKDEIENYENKRNNLNLEIDAICIQLKREFQLRIDKHGPNFFNSKHETLGFIAEEYNELLTAIRENGIIGKNKFKAESMDLAIACLFGIISSNNNYGAKNESDGPEM